MEPYEKTFWGFSNGGKKKEIRLILSWYWIKVNLYSMSIWIKFERWNIDNGEIGYFHTNKTIFTYFLISPICRSRMGSRIIGIHNLITYSIWQKEYNSSCCFFKFWLQFFKIGRKKREKTEMCIMVKFSVRLLNFNWKSVYIISKIAIDSLFLISANFCHHTYSKYCLVCLYMKRNWK